MRKIVRKTITMAAWIGVTIVSLSPLHGERVDEIPNPRVQSGSYVMDVAGVLGPEYTAMIDEICRKLKTATTAEMAVVTVANLGGTSVEDFADRLFRGFGIGEKGKDNGILLLFSRDDRLIRLEVGYGLEKNITDIASGRLLESYALPNFRKGLYGQGLYLTARETALMLGASLNAPLSLPEPSGFPPQIAVTQKTAPLAARKSGFDSVMASIIYAAGAFGLVFLGIAITFLRFRSRRGKAARQKIISTGWIYPVTMWIAAIFGFFFIVGMGQSFFPPFLALAAPVGATFTFGFSRRWLRRSLASYHLDCPSCKNPMDLVPESEDNQMLSTEESAEETAGGMDYEIWKCGKCGASERLSVKMEKAGPCPKCKRRTLVSSRLTLVAATTASNGRVRIVSTCKNPNCDYSHTEERSTPRISTSSSSSHGSSGSGSHSSSSSFGGGRSGGGGASKGW